MDDGPLTGPAKPANPAVERASTLILNSPDDLLRLGRTYGRGGGPTRDSLAAAAASLEGSEEPSALAPSGLGAVTAALLACAQSGDHVLVSDGCYLPTRAFCNQTLPGFGIAASYYRPGDLDDLAAQLRPETKAVLVEQPASLTFEVEDLPAVVAIAHAQGAAVIVDHSWGGGLAFKPLELGADLAALSLTKYPSGGSDVFMGAVSGRGPRLAAARDLLRRLGSAVSPDDCYLVLRGLNTLSVRFARHEETALALAAWLEERSEVVRVAHPALPSHPGHAVFSRDFHRGSGVFGVELKPATKQQMLGFFGALQTFQLGYSYGGFESLAIWSDPQLRRRTHRPALGGPLIRLAVGLDPLEALQEDLARAFTALATA